jgi:methionine synthase / methylenetetrahydrofolate reductase (NADH)
VRDAEFMANEVPGVSVPDAILARMRATRDDSSAIAEGVRIAQELGRTLKPMAQGVHISSTAAGTAAVLAVMEGLH